MPLFNYSKLSYRDCELLIIDICRDILGISTRVSSTGRDRGRDGIFEGTTNKYPSETAPWSGTIVIQSKHTEKMDAKYKDKAFFSEKNKASELHAELLKVRAYLDNKEVIFSHYLLFSNRLLPLNVRDEFKQIISTKLNLPIDCVDVFGIADIDNYLIDLPNIARKYNLLPDIQLPIEFNPSDIMAVICAIHQVYSKKDKTDQSETQDFTRIPFETKAAINNMSQDYATVLQDTYMPNLNVIKDFLADPRNDDHLQQYEESIHELKLKVAAQQGKNCCFDDIINGICDTIKRHRDAQGLNNIQIELINSVITNMFIDCHIGRKVT